MTLVGKKRLFFGIGTCVAVFLLGLILVEISLRVFGDDLILSELYKADYDVSYVLKPGLSGNLRGSEIRFNEQGFRHDGEILRKKKDEYRILCLGDSMTFGLGVNLEDSWPKQLEEKFRSSHLQVTVVNAGVPSYDTHNEWVYVSRIQKNISPDMVIIGFWNNDTGKSFHFHKRDTFGYMSLKWAMYNLRTINAMKQVYLKFKDSGQKKIKPEKLQHKKADKEDCDNDFNVATNPDFQRIIDALHNFSKWSDENKVPVIVAHLPGHAHGDDQSFQSEIYATVESHCLNNLLPYIDLRPAFRDFSGDSIDLSLIKTINDSHTSPLGNNLIASYLFENLQSKIK